MRHAAPDVLATLQRLKVEHVVFGEEIGIRCPWCGYPDTGAPDKTCSINAETGWGKCQHGNRCSQGGFNLYQLRRKLGDQTLPGADMDVTPQEYKKPKAVSIHDAARKPCAEYIASRGLDPALVKATGLVQAAQVNTKHGPSHALAFRYVENGALVEVKFRAEKGDGDPWKNFTRAGKYPGLFGYDRVDPNEGYLVFSGGELDTLAAWEMGVPNVVNGPSESDCNWIANYHDWLAGFEHFFIATDSDKTGEQKANEIAGRLGREKCFRIRFPKGCKDLLDAKVKGGWDIHKFRLAMAKADEFKPKLLRCLRDFMDEIWADEKPVQIGDMTQFPRLNDAFDGFRGGEMTLWSGDDGAGKSTFLLNIERHWMLSRVPICVGSFELSPVRQGRWLRAMGFKDRAQMEEAAAYFYVINRVGSMNPNELIESYVYAAQRYGVRHFFTDSVSMLDIEDDDYAAQAKFIREIQTRLVQPFLVHHHTVAHPRKGRSDATTGRDKADIRGNMHRFHDNVVMVCADEKEDGTRQSFLIIKKSREKGLPPKCTILLSFDRDTRTYTEAIHQ